jgi:hypothetical protein
MRGRSKGEITYYVGKLLESIGETRDGIVYQQLGLNSMIEEIYALNKLSQADKARRAEPYVALFNALATKLEGMPQGT